MALVLSGMKRKERKKIALKALDRVGIKDQAKKMPNQLSGGQMQRVAIARAIVNNPEIILADEPTGALDSKTSVQVMEILKEISADKLVILVTHNRELATKYSDRIVELLDGEIKKDKKITRVSKPSELKGSNIEGEVLAQIETSGKVLKEMPVESNVEEVFALNKEKKNKTKKEKTSIRQKKKTSMSFFTALSLSLRNLRTKKWRTGLISFAGSIDIIGIALVASLSNGFTKYIDKMQTDVLSSYPLTIASSSMDMGSFMEMAEEERLTEFPSDKIVNINKISEKLGKIQKTNKITDDYVKNVVEKMNSDWYYELVYDYGMDFNVYREGVYGGSTVYVEAKLPASIQSLQDTFLSGTGTGIWQQMVDNDDYIKTQYDVLEGKLPEAKDEIIVMVDKYNQIADIVLSVLGLDASKEGGYTFEEIMAMEFYVTPNNTIYSQVENKFVKASTLMAEPTGSVKLKVVGILRPNEQTDVGVMSSTIGYTKALSAYMREQNAVSDIVTWQTANPTINALTGEEFVASEIDGLVDEQRASIIRKLGGASVPSVISIYAKDFDSKESIKAYLDDYNKGVAEEDQVHYSDLMGSFMTILTNIVDIISYVLIAFTSISLVVSSIMIGVITYISVLERTKEIGILRSIGARKRDISNVFNAETLSMGLISGILGVGLAWILTFPVSAILEKFAGVKGLMVLNPLHGLLLIAVSVVLTLISGLIPSRIAAKKDPVVALRSQ